MAWIVTGITDDGSPRSLGLVHERWEKAKSELDELKEIGEANPYDAVYLTEVS